MPKRDQAVTQPGPLYGIITFRVDLTKPKLMKKIALTLSLALTFWLSVLAQTTPAADEVIDKYIAAIGGKDVLLKVQDLTTYLSSEIEREHIIITWKQKLPNKFSMAININGMEMMMRTGNGSKVAMGGMQGSRTLDGPAAQQMILMNIIFPELHYTENGVKTTFVGSEKVEGKDTYKLSHATADGATTWTDNFDVTTGLKVQSVTSGQSPRGQMTTTSLYTDYKDVNGIKFPMTIVQQSPRGSMTMSVDNVKVNKGIKDSEFNAN
ncbi:LolA-like protein [Spirosoma fluminis]